MKIAMLYLPVLLQIGGVVIVIAEVVLPSGGLLSLAALLLFGYSIFYLFQNVSAQAGLVLLAVDLVLIPVFVVVGLKLLARSPVTLRTSLSRSRGVTAQDESLASLVGEAGETLTELHPSGLARLRGQRVDVVTAGEFLPQGCRVEVTEVMGNRVVVREIMKTWEDNHGRV